MSLTSTPIAERINIVLCGLRNAGKSSLFNNILGRQEAIVSNNAGTTTDPVTKMMEIGKLGPVSITDTAGIDDIGQLGSLRIDKSLQSIKHSDIVILVTNISTKIKIEEQNIITECEKNNKPFIIVATHTDKKSYEEKIKWIEKYNFVYVNNNTLEGIEQLKNLLESYNNKIEREITVLQDIVQENDFLFLVTPVDSAAPKGRLILPQVETIRDALDRGCGTMLVQADKLKTFYNQNDVKPNLVITDSQAFQQVAQVIPQTQNLTSFSILFARKKGDINYYIDGLAKLKNVPKNAKILILECCTHHKQEDDIGTVKIPRLFQQKIESTVTFDFAHGLDMDINTLKQYHLVINCGACMITRNIMMSRLETLKKERIAVTNYGLFLAYINNLLPRALECLPDAYKHYKEII